MTELLATHGDLLVGALTLCCLMGLVLQNRGQRRLLNAQTQRMEDLQGVVSAYGQSLIACRGLIEQMEARLGEFTDRNLEIQSQFAFNRSFEEASRLVKDGTTVESLVNDCGLSDAEAALMIRLHQRDEAKPRQQWRQPAVANPARNRHSPAIVATNSATTASKASTEASTEVLTELSAEDDSPLTSEEIRLKESLARAQSR